MADDLTALDEAQLQARADTIRARMRPLEQELTSLRSDRDQVLTEIRRRERLRSRQSRAGLKEEMKAGKLPSVAELVAGSESGAFDEYTYNLKTGGEVRLGFPGARGQSLAFTDGKQVAQARDLAEAGSLYAAGWELGSPGRPGVRVHFPGTRQERLADASEVFVRPASGGENPA